MSSRVVINHFVCNEATDLKVHIGGILFVNYTNLMSDGTDIRCSNGLLLTHLRFSQIMFTDGMILLMIIVYLVLCIFFFFFWIKVWVTSDLKMSFCILNPLMWAVGQTRPITWDRDCLKDKSGQDLHASILIPSELSEIDPSIFCVSQVCRLHCDIHL